MPKKIPMRRCIATNEQLPKKDLLRIVRTPEGEIKVDVTGKMNGHGAYLKKSEEAVAIAKQKGSLRSKLGVDIPEEVYEEILKVIR